MNISLQELARSLELYNLQVALSAAAQRGEKALEFTKEPPLRIRQEVARVVVAFGSYDPLTVGHEELFKTGLDAAKHVPSHRAGPDELAIVTSVRHIEKTVDYQRNSSIADRIHSQEGFASAYGNVSLAFFNDPLFINLLPKLEQAYGSEADIYFLVGADVMEKIVDPASYKRPEFEDNSDAAAQKRMEGVVDKLFRHRFIVSDRVVEYKNSGKPPRYVDAATLNREHPALQPHADRLIPIQLPSVSILEIPITEVSASKVRERRSQRKDVRALEAIGISDFVERRDLYLDNNRYQAFVCAREMFADYYRKRDVSIAGYLPRLAAFLSNLDADTDLCTHTIQTYRSCDREPFVAQLSRETRAGDSPPILSIPDAKGL